MYNEKRAASNKRYRKTQDFFELRLPEGLRERIHEGREITGESFNWFIIDAVERKLAEVVSNGSN